MENAFKNILKGKVVIVGIGNILKGDDGFGPALIERLRGRTRAVCMDAGAAPENFIGKIAKENPDVVLLVDAAAIGSRPADWEILKARDMAKIGFTTHDIPPAMLIERLEKDTGADVYVLGVQPENLALGAGMSARIRKALDDIENRITEAMNA